MSNVEDTLDEFSTDVFDTETSREESYINEHNAMLFSSSFSRSFGDLEQLQDDIKKFAHETQRRRSVSLKKFDVNDVLVEHAHQTVSKWIDTAPSSPAEFLKNRDSYPTMPMSPSCYRRMRKQKEIPKEMLSIDLSSIKDKMLQRDTPKNGRRNHFDCGSDTPSRKNETSEEISCLATLDEYSNSIFIEDEDPTVGDPDASDFGDDYDELNNENCANFVNFEEQEDHYQLYITNKSPQRGKADNTPETVSFNPLFASMRAQSFIDTRKQAWRVPAEEDVVSFENPLFNNYLLRQKLSKQRVAWEVPVETPKAKRRFFKRQSLTDILQNRTLRNAEHPRGTPETKRALRFVGGSS